MQLQTYILYPEIAKFSTRTISTVILIRYSNQYNIKKAPKYLRAFRFIRGGGNYLLSASATPTATATVAPTIGLLPIPRKPIISTCAGTEEEPAN